MVGRGQESFDKQSLMDWSFGEGLKGREGVVMPADVVARTEEKYSRVDEILGERILTVGCEEQCGDWERACYDAVHGHVKSNEASLLWLIRSLSLAIYLSLCTSPFSNQ